MAMTHDYLDYLNQRVGIAPANSQEELQAAQTIARLMSHHDVEPQIEEFDAPSLAGLSAAILSVLMFVGVLVSGVGVLALTLAIVGGLNWGAIGLFNFDLVAFLCGGSGTWLARIIYAVVGLVVVILAAAITAFVMNAAGGAIE